MRFRVLLFGFILLPFSTLRADETPRDCVVLLHGIGMRGIVMQRMATALEAGGYRVVNISYPSRRMAFEALAGDYLPEQLRANDVASAPHLHFVTHSLGSLVLRKFLQDSRPANLGRVVMVGPPNHGSAAADEAKQHDLLRLYLGENLARLGTDEDSIVELLGPADFEVGVIAGEVPINPIFGKALAGKNDGAVTIESARLEGMRDFLVVPYSHTVMLWRSEVIEQTLRFLKEGKFKHKPVTETPASAVQKAK